MTAYKDQRLGPYCCPKHKRRERACEACRETYRRYERRRNKLNRSGRTTLVDAAPAHRRLSALMALGWPLSWLAGDLGTTQQGISDLMRGRLKTSRVMDRRVRDLYERLWNVRPVGRTGAERMAITRTLIRAQQYGYEPPMAWDDEELDRPGVAYIYGTDEAA